MEEGVFTDIVPGVTLPLVWLWHTRHSYLVVRDIHFAEHRTIEIDIRATHWLYV